MQYHRFRCLVYLWCPGIGRLFRCWTGPYLLMARDFIICDISVWNNEMRYDWLIYCICFRNNIQHVKSRIIHSWHFGFDVNIYQCMAPLNMFQFRLVYYCCAFCLLDLQVKADTFIWFWALSYYNDLTLSQSFRPLEAQLNFCDNVM